MRVKPVYIGFDHPQEEGLHHDYYRIRIIPVGQPFSLQAPYHQVVNTGVERVELNAALLSNTPTVEGYYDIYVTTATIADTESAHAVAENVYFGPVVYTDTTKPGLSQFTDLLRNNIDSRYKDTFPFESLELYTPEEITGITNTRIRVVSEDPRAPGDVYLRYNRITSEKFFAIKPQYIQVNSGSNFSQIVSAINAACQVNFVIGVDTPSQTVPTPNSNWQAVNLNMQYSLAYCGIYTFYYSTSAPE